MSTVTTADVIDSILGIKPGSAAAALRATKPEYITQNQDYYISIFEPDAESQAAFPAVERALVAIRIAAHTNSTAVIDWYSGLAASLGATDAQIAAVKDVENAFADATRFGAALRRADRVTLQPDTTEPEHIAELKAAGFTPAGILSLSQTIAFVNYQLRLIAGLRAFGVSA